MPLWKLLWQTGHFQTYFYFEKLWNGIKYFYTSVFIAGLTGIDFQPIFCFDFIGGYNINFCHFFMMDRTQIF